MGVNKLILESPNGVRPNTFAFGFRGLLIEYSTGVRFIKVTDFRGNPLSGAVVTVENSGGDYSQTTDLLGFAELQIDLTGTKVVKILKNKTNLTTSFTYSTDPITKTVIIQPRIVE
jgi:hypothetical protein